jgi:hypothetical protein
MSTGVVVYIAIGLFVAYLEHRLVDDGSEWEQSTSAKLLGAVQLVIHYSRLTLTWPWYLLEEWVIKASNREET